MKAFYIKYVVVMMTLGLASCDGDSFDDIPENEVQARRLSGTWTVGSDTQVQRDGADISAEYVGFSALFTEQLGYVIKGDPNNVIYPEGTWNYSDENYTHIILNNDGKLISVSVNEANTVMTLIFSNDANSPIGSRTSGITGQYTFVLTKE